MDGPRAGGPQCDDVAGPQAPDAVARNGSTPPGHGSWPRCDPEDHEMNGELYSAKYTAM